MRTLHPIEDIARALDRHAAAIAQDLLPAGRRSGREWRVGSIAGEPGMSLSIRIAGPHAGRWRDFAEDIGGDMLELVARVRFGGDKRDALAWARRYLGLDSGPAPAERPPPPVPAKQVPEHTADLTGKARALWHAGLPIGGTPAAAYLTGRGLSLAALGRSIGALRYKADAWCAERRQPAPAMLAAIWRVGAMVGCHRTFLAPRPGGPGWGKAAIAAPKKVIGQMGGGMIPLWRGRSGRPFAQAPEDDTLAICEGIEDALTIALHQPAWRVAAAVSLGNMAQLMIPRRFADIVLVWDRDGDRPGPAEVRARAVTRLLGQGRSVREVFPPEGFKDFNAWHMATALAEAERRGGAA